MTSFFVMQGRTYKEERKTSIIWSPQEDQSGRKQHSWERMREVRQGDIVFHYVNGYIVSISVATSDCVESPKPAELQNNNNNWNQEGYKVTLDYHELVQPLQVAKYFSRLKPLLPIKYSAFQANGQGNQGYLYPCNEELTIQLLELIREVDESLSLSISAQESLPSGLRNKSSKNMLRQLITNTESISKSKVRIGQDKFRENLEPIWNNECPLCGINLKAALRASHSKPWKDSTDSERLDPYNGILLCCNHDSLYDNGYITFDQDGSLRISKEISKEDYDKFLLNLGIKIDVYPEHISYLSWHKKYIFRG